MRNTDLVSELAKLRPGSTFLALTEYRNAHNEVANYNLSFGFSYTTAIERSIAALTAARPTTSLARQAKRELIESFNVNLARAKDEPIETRQDGYTHFIDSTTGNYIRGVKLHDETNTLHLYGLVNSKVVLEPGEYPVVNSSALTLAKNELRRGLPVSRFRQFVIAPGKVKHISVQGMKLLPE